MTTFENPKLGIFSSVISGSPSITTEKLYGPSITSLGLYFLSCGLRGQGYLDHLSEKETDISTAGRPIWMKIDAQLCSLLWQYLDPKLLDMYQAYETCYDVCSKAQSFYNNDI